jgi:hypothetical protein
VVIVSFDDPNLGACSSLRFRCSGSSIPAVFLEQRDRQPGGQAGLEEFGLTGASTYCFGDRDVLLQLCAQPPRLSNCSVGPSYQSMFNGCMHWERNSRALTWFQELAGRLG